MITQEILDRLNKRFNNMFEFKKQTQWQMTHPYLPKFMGFIREEMTEEEARQELDLLSYIVKERSRDTSKENNEIILMIRGMERLRDHIAPKDRTFVCDINFDETLILIDKVMEVLKKIN